MTSPHVHFIEQVKLQKTLVTTDAVITGMSLLTHQAQADMKACMLEKDLANLKTDKSVSLSYDITQDQTLYTDRDSTKSEHRQGE